MVSGKRRSPPSKTPGSEEPSLTPEQIVDRLHNTACQSITGARFLVSAISQQLPGDAEALRKQLETVDAALERSSNELRALIKELRSIADKDSGVARSS